MIMLNHNLRIFLRVAEKGSITEAANSLYISQPAVSKAIQTLEQELKLKLFDRNKRKGLLLTDVGQEILLLARQMEGLENRIYQAAFRSNHFFGGKVRIASMPILTSVLLADVFYRFRTKYPQVSIELMEASSMEIRKAVEEHQVDLALLSAPFGNLEHLVLFQDHIVAASKDPLPPGSVIDLTDRPERFLFCKAGQETAMELLRASKINTARSFLVEQAETVIRLAECRNGIGILSELVLDHTPNQLHRYPITPSITIDIGLAANHLDDLPPVTAELKRMILERLPSLHKEA